MERRRIGRTDSEVSEIGFGAWAIGGSWGAAEGENIRVATKAGRRLPAQTCER